MAWGRIATALARARAKRALKRGVNVLVRMRLPDVGVALRRRLGAW